MQQWARLMVLMLGAGLLAAAPVVRADSFLNSSNGRIHYELVRGIDTRPVILVHGFSTPMWVWDPLFEALEKAGTWSPSVEHLPYFDAPPAAGKGKT